MICLARHEAGFLYGFPHGGALILISNGLFTSKSAEDIRYEGYFSARKNAMETNPSGSHHDNADLRGICAVAAINFWQFWLCW